MQSRKFLTFGVALICFSFLGAGKIDQSPAPSIKKAWGYTFSKKSGKWEYHAFDLMTLEQVESLFEKRIPGLGSRSKALASHLLNLCGKYAFDPAFILALIEAESSFRTEVVSSAGAIGLMQVMPETAKVVVRRWLDQKVEKIDLRDPFLNMTLGVTYLAYLRDHYQNRFPHLLVAYNIGPARLDYLISRNRFRVFRTRKYVDSVRNGVPKFRNFGKGT